MPLRWCQGSLWAHDVLSGSPAGHYLKSEELTKPQTADICGDINAAGRLSRSLPGSSGKPRLLIRWTSGVCPTPIYHHAPQAILR